MKANCFFILTLCLFVLSSCTKDEEYSRIFESDCVDVSNDNNSGLLDTIRSWPSDLLQEWDLVRYARGTMLLKRKNENNNTKTYIVLVNLKQGAEVEMVFENTSSGFFRRKSLSEWNSSSYFAIANSCFFNASQSPNCQLPFPLKKDGFMYTYGTGGSNADKTKEKAVLNIYAQDQYAEIVSIGTNPMNYYPMNNCDNSYAGFYGNVGNSPSSSTGRTLVGIKDADGDGECEFVVLLVTNRKTQSQAYNLLMQSVSCDKVITFDGGGSSQLMCPGPLIQSTRTIPVAIAIKHG